MRIITLVTASAAALLLLFPSASPAVPPVTSVSIAQGQLAGIRTGAVTAFLGIPFAAPPVGPNRWRPPQPAPSWSGVRPARAFAASCFQPYPPPLFGPYTPEFVNTPPPSEDCLYLNVWAPAAKSQKLPVIVWIHGGGFLGGSGAVPIYNGANLASKGVVVVTINYRVGPFGFLAHPGLSAEDPRHGSGNYGLLDQIAALKWVQGNIASFGGDPRNVTLAGQSAGAAAVNSLIVSPAATGLFHRAAAQSGSGMGLEAMPLAEAEKEGVTFAAYLGANGASELRALPPERIQAALYLPVSPAPIPPGLPQVRFRPVMDGKLLPEDPSRPTSRPASPVPLLTGFTADENFAIAVKTGADFEKEVRSRFGGHAGNILALYPHATDDEAVASAKLLARDRYMASLLLWTSGRIRSSGQTIYRYMFEHPVPTAKTPSFGAFHTAEVPYLFGVLDPAVRPYGAADRKVSAQVQGYWMNFMKRGDPNGPGLPGWPKEAAAGIDVMAIGLKPGRQFPISSRARFEALRAFAADGGSLSLF